MAALSCVALVVDLDDFLAGVERRGERWAALTTRTADMIVRAECAKLENVSVVAQEPDSWVVTVTRAAPEALAAEARTLALRLRDEIAARTPATASVGVSRVVSGHAEPATAVREAALQAQATLGAKALGGAGRVYPTVEHRPFDPPDIAWDIAALLRSGACAEAVERVERWLQAVLRRQAGPAVVFQLWLPALILDVAAAVDPHRSADGSTNWRSTLAHAPLAELAGLAEMHERTHLRRWLMACMERLSGVAVVSPPSPLITRAEALIRACYHDAALSLSSAAVALAVSPYHLAHVFRAERDTTFRRRLTGVRVRAAVGMLRRGGLTVGEVGRRCGFASTRQFRATLRRETGSSPTEFLGARATRPDSVRNA